MENKSKQICMKLFGMIFTMMILTSTAWSDFYVDPTQIDQGVISEGTVAYIKNVTTPSTQDIVHFENISQNGSITYYRFDTSLDMSNRPNLYYDIDPAVKLVRVTGDETFTVYSSENLIFDDRQCIGDVNMIQFAMNAAKYGRVEIFPWTNRSMSNVRTEHGLWVDISTSTTDGIQEGINYACGNGTAGSAAYNLHIHGGEEDGSNGSYMTGGAVVYGCLNTLVFPAIQGFTITTGSITLYITPKSGPGILFDSMMMGSINFTGTQIVYTGTESAVQFRPTNKVPVDGVAAIIDSDVHIHAIVTSNALSKDAVVLFDTSNAGIGGNTFRFDEINAGDGISLTSVGIGVIADETSNGFSNNIVTCPHVHGAGLYGVQLGADARAAGKITGNMWTLTIVGLNQPNSTALKTYADGDLYTISSVSHGFDNLVHFIGNNNMLICPKIQMGIIDEGIDNMIITTGNADEPETIEPEAAEMSEPDPEVDEPDPEVDEPESDNSDGGGSPGCFISSLF